MTIVDHFEYDDLGPFRIILNTFRTACVFKMNKNPLDKIIPFNFPKIKAVITN